MAVRREGKIKATEYFTIVQGGRHVGVGQVDTETGMGRINLGIGMYRIAGVIHEDDEEHEGHYEKLPDQTTIDFDNPFNRD